MKHVVIIDDDHKAINVLKEALSGYNDLEVKGIAYNGKDGLKLIKETHTDLLFLDIELPDSNGIVLLDEIKSINNNIYTIMFTGVYPYYSKKAFKNSEDDYLLKPINLIELDKAIQRYKHYLSLSNKHIDKNTLSSKKNPEILAVTTYTSEMRLLRISDIGYFRYSSSRKVWEGALNDNTFVTLKKGTSASDILEYNNNFIQTHQSFIVNLEYIMLIGSNCITLYPPFNENEVLVGRTFRKELQDKIMCI